MELKNLERIFDSLQGCCLHQAVWLPRDATMILCSIYTNDNGDWEDSLDYGAYGNWKDGTESSSYTIARLRSGKLGLLAEWEDYTGHGCQCDSSTSIYDNLTELLRYGIPEDYPRGAREAIETRLGPQ